MANDAPKESLGRHKPDKIEEEHAKHADLQKLIERRDDIDERLIIYSNAEKSDNVVETLEAEREVIETRIAELRDWFDGKFDDVENVTGEPTISELDTLNARVPDDFYSGGLGKQSR